MVTRPPLAEEYPETPRPMKFTDRDGQILETIHAFEGMMGDYQIERLHFTSDRQTRERLSILWQNGWLARLHPQIRPSYPCMVYWLGERGAGYIAGLRGQDLKDFKWKEQPRENDITHDLEVNGFRLDVMAACDAQPQFGLVEWVSGYEFFVYPDEITFPGFDGRRSKRRIVPDGYFVLSFRTTQDKLHRFRFILELDRGTEDNPRFVREKVLPGVAYIKSEAYRKRFGHNSGRFLVVTTSERRLENLKRHTEDALAGGKAANVFYFSTLELLEADRLKPHTLLTAPVWYRGGEEQPRPQFDLD